MLAVKNQVTGLEMWAVLHMKLIICSGWMTVTTILSPMPIMKIWPLETVSIDSVCRWVDHMTLKEPAL